MASRMEREKRFSLRIHERLEREAQETEQLRRALRLVRLVEGISLRDFGATIGVTHTYVGQFENGADISQDVELQIAEFVGPFIEKYRRFIETGKPENEWRLAKYRAEMVENADLYSFSAVGDESLAELCH